jgi:hypothetical protein
MTMTHPGLPLAWAVLIGGAALLMTLHALVFKHHTTGPGRLFSLAKLPVIGSAVRYLHRNTAFLLLLKFIFVALFLLVIIAGLWGSPIPERNIATVLTWNIWWVLIVFAVFFFGTSWCAVCPWDTLANLMVRLRLWRRNDQAAQLQLKLPRYLRNLWPATALLAGLTWLELGVGVSADPAATAGMALFMLVAAVTALALLEGKSFCRYLCPVGRTVGVYSQLSPWAVRPIEADICASCTTIDCYHGNDTVAPCPTQLVVGRVQENTYCLSCGNCSQSCPSANVGWSLRAPNHEASLVARPHADEAGFMLCLLALTGFHGLTMMPFWPQWVSQLGLLLNDGGSLLLTFTVLLVVAVLIPLAGYLAAGWLTRRLIATRIRLAQVLTGFAFSTLPLAFSYHLAHNLNHILRESSDLGALFANPLGRDTLPLSMMELHQRHLTMWLPESLLFALQGLLMIAGFYLSLQIIRRRGAEMFNLRAWQVLPMIAFALVVTSYHVAMLMQPMVMRM